MLAVLYVIIRLGGIQLSSLINVEKMTDNQHIYIYIYDDIEDINHDNRCCLYRN